MFSGVRGRNSPKQHFETLINSVKWPTHITCLPKNVCICMFLCHACDFNHQGL